MSMQDPISDMLNRIRNAQARAMREVSMPSSKLKHSICEILKQEGYIIAYSQDNETKPTLTIELKYYEGRPVIETLKRVSRPGLRIYKSKDQLPRVMNGLGIAIVSTNKGLMSDRAARQQGVGGEILCLVA
ncbi:MAG: 30S ribosomal protein S8 [Gammaproteobacteria bacterium]